MYAFSPSPPTTIPITGTADLFPVNRVFCIGRNYAAHAKEMGAMTDGKVPLYFMKSADCVNTSGIFVYPNKSSNVHYEVELVVALHRGGVNLTLAQATEAIFGYAIGLDMTRRDAQARAKAAGHPWVAAKSFPGAAPMGSVHRVADVGHPSSGSIALSLNGESAQSGNLNQMLWSVPALIAHLSTEQVLAPGDLIMTGTPAGVGPVHNNDVMVGSIDGLGALTVVVTSFS